MHPNFLNAPSPPASGKRSVETRIQGIDPGHVGENLRRKDKGRMLESVILNGTDNRKLLNSGAKSASIAKPGSPRPQQQA